MIKATIRDLEQSKNGFSLLRTKKFPPKTSYWVNRIADKVQSEINIFNKQRIELVNKYGKKDPKTGNTSVLEKNVEQFNLDIEELRDIEVTIPYEKIYIEDLGEEAIEPSALITWVFRSRDDEPKKQPKKNKK